MGTAEPEDNETAAVIVNYRTRELTLEAVRSVLGEPGVREVVVVDNASGDGSVAFLRRKLTDERVRVVESPSNVGFGQGVNAGVRHCSASLLLVLNSDAILLPGSLPALAATLLGDSSVAVVAPAVYAPGGAELQDNAHGVFPTLTVIVRRTNNNPPETLRPDWVSGVAMLMRRRDFEDIGGFDPDFTMYLEDVDLCYRFRSAGREVRRELRAGVVHGLSRSADSFTDSFTTQLEWAHRSRVLYFRKTGAPLLERLAVQVIRVGNMAVQRTRWRRSLKRPQPR